MIVGTIYAIGLLIIFIYGAIAIKHAARFRYLSQRTVYLTLFFVIASTILTILGIFTFFAIDWTKI